ncbi:MAG TPA: hypothetical protein VF121_07815 [Thermoanaerobaculia bacterium]|nr:hypothetical protein [Thermoanaerobaculia bacterium]
MLGLAVEAASATILLGPPIEVPRPFQGPPDAPSLAVLEDGSFALGRRTGERRFEVLFFTPEGNLLGEPVTVVSRNQGNSLYGGVGPFGDRYFVTWQIVDSGKAHAAFYSREGELSGPPFLWPYSDTIHSHQFFYYARGPQGRALPFFAFQRGGKDLFGDPYRAFWSRVFGPEANFLGRPVTLLTERHVLGVEDAALNEDGRFVISLLRCPRNPRSQQPCSRGLQVFDGAWRPRSALRTKGLPPVHWRIKHVSLALARTGDHLLVWTQDFGSAARWDDDRLLAQIFRRDGSPAAGQLRISAPRTHGAAAPLVAATHASTFVVAWVDVPDGFRLDVHMREVDGRTGQMGQQILVARNINPVGYGFELNTSGRGVIWYGDHLRLVTVEPDATIELLAASEGKRGGTPP